MDNAKGNVESGKKPKTPKTPKLAPDAGKPDAGKPDTGKSEASVFDESKLKVIDEAEVDVENEDGKTAHFKVQRYSYDGGEAHTRWLRQGGKGKWYPARGFDDDAIVELCWATLELFGELDEDDGDSDDGDEPEDGSGPPEE